MVDEYAEVFKSEEEKQKPKEEGMEAEYKDIHEIINERNKIHDEKNIRVPDCKERIGRLNLDLFGDPDNKPDWISNIDKIKEELDHPYTKSHPITNKVKIIVEEMKALQIEYRDIQRFYDKFVKQIGELLDSSIKMYLKDVESQKKMLAELSAGDKLKEADEKITEYMVNKFMEREGNAVLDKYNKAIEDKDVNTLQTIKALFVRKAKDFFIGKHPDPKRIGNLLFDKYTQFASRSALSDDTNEKNIQSETQNIQKELNGTNSEPLKETETSNSEGNNEENEAETGNMLKSFRRVMQPTKQ